MADELTNIDTDPTQLYNQYSVPQPPFTSITNVEGDTTTVVTTIRGNSGQVSGPDVGIIADPATGYAFDATGNNNTFTLDSAATVRSSISAAESGINTDITQLNGASQVDVSSDYKVNGVQVVTDQQAAIPDATGGVVIDTEARTAINDLLAALRVHGLINT